MSSATDGGGVRSRDGIEEKWPFRNSSPRRKRVGHCGSTKGLYAKFLMGR
jgi:hypothetical protein